LNIVFLFEQNSAFLLFADGAWYENMSYNNLNKQKQDTPYSVGAGVLFQTKLGMFQLNYAVGHQYNNFGVVNTF